MKKVLKDPIAPTQKTHGKFPFDFKGVPSYDDRTSSSIPAGNYYGVGFRTPVGRETARPMSAGPVPQESECFSPKEIFYGGEDKKG
jgi:hypothetical protein